MRNWNSLLRCPGAVFGARSAPIFFNLPHSTVKIRRIFGDVICRITSYFPHDFNLPKKECCFNLPNTVHCVYNLPNTAISIYQSRIQFTEDSVFNLPNTVISIYQTLKHYDSKLLNTVIWIYQKLWFQFTKHCVWNCVWKVIGKLKLYMKCDQPHIVECLPSNRMR